MPNQVKSRTKSSQQTKDLKAFALFILENHLDEFAEMSLTLSRKRKIPLLKYLTNVQPTELKALVRKSNSDLLTSLSEGKSKEHTQATVRRWMSDQLPVVERDQVVVEDITLVNRVRKELFLHFIPKFTKDMSVVIQLINEIDDYLLEYTSSSFRAFINLLEGRIREHVKLTEHANESFKQAQAITHIGNYEWDLTTSNLTWSDELYRIYGLAPGTDLPDSRMIQPYTHPDDKEIVSKHIEHSKTTLAPFDFYYRIILQNGSEKTLHARGEVIPDETGKAARIIGTTQDVTKEKNLEKKLIENQIFIQKIADATPAIIASYNIKTGKYVFINDALKKLLGYDVQEALSKGIEFASSIVHPDDVASMIEKNQEALHQANDQSQGNRAESIVEFQYRMKHINGEYRWFHTFGTVFNRDNNNQVEHVLNVSLDITERVKAEQVLLQRTAELQQSNASLEEFAFVASHDLKEPLRKIVTFSDRLLNTYGDQVPEEGKNYLEKIMSASIRMQQMISDLLSLSVITTDKVFSSVNLQQMLDEVLMTFEHKMEESGARVQTDNLPDATVVPAQFRQLFQNLISNSLKFSKQSTPPAINVTHAFFTKPEAAFPDLKKADQYLKLEVSDNGIGFDNSHMDKIFAVFQRLHHRDIYEGTGIGLAICKKIVEHHGGVIFASGVPNQGAKFTIILPQ